MEPTRQAVYVVMFTSGGQPHLARMWKRMKRVSLNTVGWLILAGGLCLTIPSACVLVDDPRAADADVALALVIRIPFEGLNTSHTAKAAFEVPLQWERMREQWGDPVYVVMARAGEDASRVLPFEKLGIHVSVTAGGRSLNLEQPTYHPYAYSINEGQIGVIFKPRPSDQVVLDVSVPEDIQLPAGELEVVGFSRSYTKDRAVGLIMDEDFRRWSKRLLPAGISLITIGALIAFARRTSSTKAV